MKKKLRDSRGLSLVEMLCAVLILILLGLMVNTGVQLALDSYRRITAQSELELLLSTLSDTLMDDLRYARDVRIEGEGTPAERIYYNSDSYNGENDETYLWLNEENGQIYAGAVPLLPQSVYGNGAYVAGRLDLRYQESPDGCFFLVVLEVRQAEGDISAGTELTVRCLSERPVPLSEP